MYKIGVVGPSTSVTRILEVTAQFKEDIIAWVPFVYQDVREVTEILQTADPQINGWFFSGPLPYLFAKEHIGLQDHFFYCPTTGAGFYNCCLKIAANQHTLLSRISTDILINVDLEQWLQELHINCDQLYIKKFDFSFSPQDLIDFHLALWQEGKTDAVITTINSVYCQLQQAGVPVYFNSLSRMEIYQALLVMIEKVKSSYFKTTQIGVIIIELRHYDAFIEKSRSPYHLQQLELRIKQALLPLCEFLNGYIMDKGAGTYEIFSSRGLITKGLPKLKDVLLQLTQEFELNTAIGVGFGDTVFTAKINAHRAVSITKDHDIAIVQDDGTIIESAGETSELSYCYESVDPLLLQKLSQASISIRTYSKIKAIIQRMGWSSFTAEQLAGQMTVTIRNVRRTIASLVKADLLVCIGEEAPVTSGRPRKIYQLAPI